MTTKKNITAKPKETVTKEVSVHKVNDAPETSKAVADIPNTPTVQARVAPESKIGPVQPEAPTASDVAEALQVTSPDQPIEHKDKIPTMHTVSAGDLENHPELKEQGLKEGDQINHGKYWVHKYPTADRSTIVQEEWPRDITAERIN